MDIAILAETNLKWTTKTTDIISVKMKDLGRNTEYFLLIVKLMQL